MLLCFHYGFLLLKRRLEEERRREEEKKEADAKEEKGEFLDKIEEKFLKISTAAETRVVELNDKKCCVVA